MKVTPQVVFSCGSAHRMGRTAACYLKTGDQSEPSSLSSPSPRSVLEVGTEEPVTDGTDLRLVLR